MNKVLAIVDDISVLGGVEAFVMNLREDLLPLGYEVHIINLSGKKKSESYIHSYPKGLIRKPI
ncbi:MAG: hypothetical protein M3Q97_08945, partial [Bacteroidota bacterium]|nr:hypothetical protein [Bacteroidota bacterium]